MSKSFTVGMWSLKSGREVIGTVCHAGENGRHLKISGREMF